MASNSSMQREVIKWLQTLELSSPLKNPRREIMSGFIVAEILSRFDKNLSLHSFDTGSAVSRRLDNWNQIEKYLKAKQCKDITPEDIRGTLMGTQGAAQNLIEKLYTFITKKPLKVNLPVIEKLKVEEEKKPAFMRPTIAELVRLQNNNTIQRLGNLTGQTDEVKFIETNSTILQKQREFHQQDRLAHHERYERPKIPMKNLIAMVKGKHDGISMPSSGPGADGTMPSHHTGNVSPSPRSRHAHHHQTKQVSLRTHNADLVGAFQQRQQHERDEQFRHQFDVDEDINRALSRVVARPLQASGHFTLALELGAASSVMSKNDIDHLTAMDIAPSSPTFPRVDILSTILAHSGGGHVSSEEDAADEEEESLFPPTVIDACFEQLLSHNVKHNAARLLQQRPDDVVHLILLIDLVLNTGNIENVVRILRVVEEIGQHVSRLDPTGRTFGIRDELIAGLCPRIGDFLINNEQKDHDRVLTSAFCKMLIAFTNLRDSDSLKKLLELVPKHTAPERIRSRVEATVVATVFSLLSPAELRVPGVESIGAFHASALIHRSSSCEVACGWEIFRCIAPISAASASTAVHFASQLALALSSSSSTSTLSSREQWETSMLALVTIMKAAVAHYEYWTNNDDAVDEGMELLDLIEATSVRLFEFCTLISSSRHQSFFASSTESDQRRAVFCAVAPLLRADVNASVAVTFVQKFILELPEMERETLMKVPTINTAMGKSNNHHKNAAVANFESLVSSNDNANNHNNNKQNSLSSATSPALPSCTGKAEYYPTSGLPLLWNIPELLVIVRILCNSLSSLQVIEMLSALLVVPLSSSSGTSVPFSSTNNNNTSASNSLAVQERHRAAWEDTLRYAKVDLVNAVRNPVDLRDVSDADLPRCQSLASQVLSVLFHSLNGDGNTSNIGGGIGAANNDGGDYAHENNNNHTDHYYGSDAYDEEETDSQYNNNNNNNNNDEENNSPVSDNNNSANRHLHHHSPGRVPFGAVDWVSSL